jgi:hypothetical protein
LKLCRTKDPVAEIVPNTQPQISLTEQGDVTIELTRGALTATPRVPASSRRRRLARLLGFGEHHTRSMPVSSPTSLVVAGRGSSDVPFPIFDLDPARHSATVTGRWFTSAQARLDPFLQAIKRPSLQ